MAEQRVPLLPDDTGAISILVHEGNRRASFSVSGQKGCFTMEKDGSVTRDEQCGDEETLFCASDEMCLSKSVANMTIFELREHLKNLPDKVDEK